MRDEGNISPALRQALEAVLGDAGVVDDAQRLASRAADWSEAAACAPALLLLPRDTGQLARTLALLHEAGRRVVIQGGLTGLAGGASAQPGEIAVGLERMQAIEAVDSLSASVTVQAGVTLQQLQDELATQGWMFPLDLGSRGSCQLGGNAATNAGGNRVLRYGTMRELVLGLEVVLPDGSVLEMLDHVRKNTTGVDLKQLFIGSEGTLGVISRLVLALRPLPAASHTALCAVGSFDAAARLLQTLRRELPGLSAFECMWDDYLEAAVQATAAPWPFAARHPLHVLIETHDTDEQLGRDLLEQALARALEHELVDDALLAQSLAEAQRLWAYRESIGELLARLKPHAAFDVALPLSAMGAFVERVRELLRGRYAGSRQLFFGHAGDGNLHLLSGPHHDAAELHGVEQLVYREVAAAGGRISAEHGIGVIKKQHLGLNRDDAQLRCMRALKNAFDPRGLLNPGRILDTLPEPCAHG
jgi:FAD/FMN-containing dehydrogenase